MLNGCKTPPRAAVFISGGGSTLQALLEMQHQLKIQLVVSNRSKAIGLLKAKRFGTPVLTINKQTSDAELTAELQKRGVNFIILAGFMKILSAEFVNEWAGRMINIHPSLLPNYKGLEAAERSWQDNADMGVTIHHVTEQMDEGEVVFQQTSLQRPQKLNFSEAALWLRKTEQHLLRQVSFL